MAKGKVLLSKAGQLLPSVLPVLLLAAALAVVPAVPAFAAGLEDSVRNVLNFGKLVLVVVLLFVAFKEFIGHNMVRAVVILVIGAILYVGATPEVLQALGNAIKDLLKIG